MRTCAIVVIASCILTFSAWADEPTGADQKKQEPDLQTIHKIWHPIALDTLKDKDEESCNKAIASGRETAIADWKNKQAKIYAIENSRYTQEFDTRTGLDIEYHSACLYPTEMFAWIDGYNQYLVEQLQEHGLPENNRLQWAEEISNPKRAISDGKDVQQLTFLGEAIPGPNNTTLRWGIDEKTHSYFYIFDAEGKQLHKIFMSISSFQESINIAWGSKGSNVVFMQVLKPYIKNSFYRYYSIDIQTGKRLFSQLGRELPPVKKPIQ